MWQKLDRSKETASNWHLRTLCDFRSAFSLGWISLKKTKDQFDCINFWFEITKKIVGRNNFNICCGLLKIHIQFQIHLNAKKKTNHNLSYYWNAHEMMVCFQSLNFSLLTAWYRIVIATNETHPKWIFDFC